MSRRKRYSLVASELPEAEIARRSSIYDELLDEFCQGGANTVRLEYSDKSINALMAGLRSRIKARGISIRVVLRKGKLYLTKA